MCFLLIFLSPIRMLKTGRNHSVLFLPYFMLLLHKHKLFSFRRSCSVPVSENILILFKQDRVVIPFH